VLGVDALHHDEPLLRRDRFHPIDSGGFLALIFLRDPSYCEQSGCSGLHQQFLQCVDRLRIATAFGFEDAFLYAVDMPFELAPGQLVPTFTLKVGRWLFLGCLRMCHTLHASSFHKTVPTSAYPLVSQRHLLLRQSCSQGLTDGFLLVVSTCNESRLESSPVPMFCFALW
jgi:hypothetical protein